MQLPVSNGRGAALRTHTKNNWTVSSADPTIQRSASDAEQPKELFRVAIADHDAMSSHLLANAVSQERRYQTTAVQPADLLRSLAVSRAHLVVIGAEQNHEPRNGFDLAHAVCRAHPDILIVILLRHSGRDLVINAFRSGARGVISREQPVAEFLDCIEHVRRGFIWAGRQESDFVLQILRNLPATDSSTGADVPGLTDRELQVVQHAATGKTNKMIAHEMHLSQHTVKNYMFRAFEKLGVSSRVELLFYLTIRGHRLDFATAVPADNRAGDIAPQGTT